MGRKFVRAVPYHLVPLSPLRGTCQTHPELPLGVQIQFHYEYVEDSEPQWNQAEGPPLQEGQMDFDKVEVLPFS